MKLQKYKCGTCGFEWFERVETGSSDHNIDHGCPQGCDDARKVIRSVDVAERKKEWICWILRKEQIDSTAKEVGLSSKKIKKNNYEDIVREFIKELKKESRQWKRILEDAIETVVRCYKLFSPGMS